MYPNRGQLVLIKKSIGCSRYVYNHFLNLWSTAYKETGKGLSYCKCSSQLPKLKKDPETQWLKEVDSMALQASLGNLSDSFDRFFSRQNKYPRFKKKGFSQSYTTKNNNGSSIRVENSKIKLPKLGWVKFANSRKIKGRIINATLSLRPSGRVSISVLCEEEIQLLPKTSSSIGIDLGIKDFAILSNEKKIDNPHFTKNMKEKLRKEQKKLSRRYEEARNHNQRLSECKNYQKQKVKVAKIHEHIANKRNDFLNKLSIEIIKNHDIICIEDLNTQGMLRNRRLAKSISDVSWSSFVTKLQYKADWYGKDLVKIDRWYPSSQICSECGHRAGKKPLNIRNWTCKNCGAELDRGINAAVNILNEGLRIRTIA